MALDYQIFSATTSTLLLIVGNERRWTALYLPYLLQTSVELCGSAAVYIYGWLLPLFGQLVDWIERKRIPDDSDLSVHETLRLHLHALNPQAPVEVPLAPPAAEWSTEVNLAVAVGWVTGFCIQSYWLSVVFRDFKHMRGVERHTSLPSEETRKKPAFSSFRFKKNKHVNVVPTSRYVFCWSTAFVSVAVVSMRVLREASFLFT
ncbi:hypothetical protein M3Y99_01057600 [Aphelenchoides fujianensis]|nr:hypothetical protein M3Y99_01057600 [Aphelenchoides fujianensis]